MNKPYITSYVLGLFMVSSAALTIVMTPSVEPADQQKKIDLETLIPAEFSDWKIDLSAAPPLVSPDEQDAIDKIYNQTLSRTYINSQGERVMLSIAHGGDQKKDLQVHRPEVCYRTNGFSIGKLTKDVVDTTIGQIPVLRLVAKLGARNEPITYWIRVGDTLARGWFEQKVASISYGFTGKIPDGLLFRISNISNDERESYQIQQAFLTTLLQAVRSEDRHWLVGQLAPN